MGADAEGKAVVWLLSRYKYSLTPKIKGYVEWILEHYKEDKKQLEDYKNSLMPSVTQGYSLSGGVQTGVSNPTEDTAIKLVTNPYILSTERNIRAIERVLEKCDETDLKLIDLVYWRRTYTVVGAGKSVGLGQNGVYKRINKILTRIAVEIGIVNI
jgi:RinA family phage transcriptional activator